MQELFKNPTIEYRGKPFWSWNGELKKEELFRQIDNFKRMGMGGYFCHSRIGLITEYLGEEWFELINECADYGEKIGMETWLYDEDRWPSGIAGGKVTEDSRHRMCFLRLNMIPSAEFVYNDDIIAAFSANVSGMSFTEKKVLSKDEVPKGNTVLFFTKEEMAKNPFYNGYTYANTLSRETTERFIETTHEQYAKHCGERLGKNISGIFTDEPHRGSVMCGFGLDNESPEYLTPYTDSLFPEFEKRFGYSLKDNLPELFLFENGEKINKVKWQYMELLQELFLENFFLPISDWCRQHNMKLTGHVLQEESLASQASSIGSVMRAYEYMDVPGIDVLFENKDFWIPAQLRSACRQLGKKWMLSETYGVTGWQFDFAGHKALGDWQALFGINLRCHHLSWYTMQGEAKRDCPASISHQSAWYTDYSVIEDYFARFQLLLMQGEPVCDVLVVNPIESVWAIIYPGWSRDLVAVDEDVKALENSYTSLMKQLAGAKIDFDIGDEDFIMRFSSVEKDSDGAYLRVGEMRYKSIILPKMLTLRKTTLDKLEEFVLAGGDLFFSDEPCGFIDCLPNDSLKKIKAKTICNESITDIFLRSFVKTDRETNQIFAAVRKVGEDYIVALVNTDRENGYDDVRITFGADGFIEQWDLRTGDISLLGTGNSLCHSFPPCGELVVKISKTDNGYKKKRIVSGDVVCMAGEYEYTLTEPNVCVLDFCRYRINDGDFSEECQIKQVDDAVRAHFNLRHRDGSMLQPWFRKQSGYEKMGMVSLQYGFWLSRQDGPLKIAIENPEHFKILINDRTGLKKLEDYWVDSCFTVFEIDSDILKEGYNTILLSCDFSEDINLEAVYLLGDFGVFAKEGRPIISTLPKTLKIGDIGPQGLPYYGAGVEYKIKDVQKASRLMVNGFGGALIKVTDGSGAKKYIFTKPYECDISDMNRDNLTVTCVLTRQNTFGAEYIKSAKELHHGLLPQGIF